MIGGSTSFFLGQHQVGQFVDDHHDIGEGLFGRDRLPEFRDVLDPLVLHEVVSPEHLPHEGPEADHREARFGHDGAQKMGNPLVGGHLEALGIDHEKTDVLGAVFHEKARDDPVQADRLPGSRRSGDQQVGHPGEVGGVGLSGHGFSDRQGQGGRNGPKGKALVDLPEGDRGAARVRNLDSDGGLVRNRDLDPDLGNLEGQGQLARQPRDPVDLESRRGREFEEGDDGTGLGAGHPARHLVDAEELGQRLLGLRDEGVRIRSLPSRRIEKRGRRGPGVGGDFKKDR